MKIKSKFLIFDSDALKNFHKRIFFSIIVFSCFYFLAIFRIADIMIFTPNIVSFNKISIEVDRGKILDRNGTLLSANINGYSLYVDPIKIKNKLYLSKQLSNILTIDYNIIYKKLLLDKEFVYLKRNISPKEYQKVIKLGEINLKTHPAKIRVYPHKNSASHIVGYVDIDNKGQAGIENAYDNILSSGIDIFLSIDINLQNAVRNELKKIVDKFSADSGIAIIFNIKNGQLLSLNNYPDFNPNNINLFNNENFKNMAFQSNYEMGSTFKPLTIAMGIEYKIIKKEMSFDVSKPIKNKIHDYHPFKGSLNIKEIIVKSSNIGTAKIAKKIGKEKQIDFFKKIGFFDRIESNFKEAALPLGNQNNWGELETMTIGYGHGFAITPMHLALAYMAVLNDGKKIKAKFLLNESDHKTNTIISKSTSNYIKELLRAVVNETEYTGPRVKIDGYDVGGKTGTAELIKANGVYDKNANRTLFVGSFPMFDPKFLIVTVINNPKKIKSENNNITGASVNAPLVKNIILRIIEIFNIPQLSSQQILKAAITNNYSKSYVVN